MARAKTTIGRIAAILSFFCALCALFGLVIAALDFRADRIHDRWPVTTSIIKSAQIELYHPFARDGGGTTYSVKTTVEFQTEGRTVDARFSSESVRKGYGTDEMNDWVHAHPPGSPLRIRFDPADPRNAEEVAPSLPQMRHTKQDLIIAGGFGAGCIAMWLLKRALT